MKSILVTLSMVFFACFTFAGSKETIIDKINSSDSIPVYISKGNVSPATYLQSDQKPRLLSKEAQQTRVNSTVSDGVDSLLTMIVSELNNVFETSKFYAAETGTHDEIKELTKKKIDDFFIVAAFHARYSYSIKRMPTRDTLHVLHLPMEYRFYSSIEFKKKSGKEGKSKKMEASISTILTSFIQHGYTINANDLIRTENPFKYIAKLGNLIKANLPVTAEKIKAKHEKVLKKRNK